MRALILLTALLGLAAEARDRRCQSRSSRTGDCASRAFFEAFGSDGAGTTTACSTTAPTGARGEALTFSRTGNATCTRTASGGLATTGIADGDLVVLSGNQPRVEYDSGGVLGLRVESARTNSLVRSQEFDNASWVRQNAGGGALPNIVSTNNTAPDGSTTAERVQFSACGTAGDVSQISQMTALTGTSSHAVYVRGFSGSGQISLCHYNGGGAVGQCAQCSFVSTSWTRCLLENRTATVNTYTVIGCNNATAVYTGAASTGAADVLLWQADQQAGAYMTSPIPTAGAAATRNAETASFSVGLTTASDFSFAESFVSPSAAATCAGLTAFSATAGPMIYSCFDTSFVARTSAGGVNADSAAAAVPAFKWQTGVRWGVVWDRAASKTAATYNGTLGTFGAAAPGVTSTAWTALSLSGDGIHTRLCAEQNQTRCR